MNIKVIFFMLLSLIPFGAITSTDTPPKCTVNLDLDVCFSSDPSPVPNVTCQEAALCKKNFSVTHMRLDPYNIAIVKDLVSMCCGPCVNFSNLTQIERVSDIKPPNHSEASDFVFPVLGREVDTKLYNYYFIPLISTPSMYYITHKRHDVMHDLLNSCINMWPLMVISLLMVMVSGFLGWLMETWSNKESFPRAFLIGWFEGFWWSFISMTTVGYGDKVPKSLPARLFSIFWIFVGITTFSLVTALLSAEITKANSELAPSMDGTKVGALRYHLYDAMVIAHHGGILTDVECSNSTEGITKMIEMLQSEIITGFVLDRYMLLMFYKEFEHNPQYKDIIKFLRKKAVRTGVKIPTRQFYGILAKNEEDYVFLIDFVKNNRNVFNTCNGLLINSFASTFKEEEIENPLFSTSGEVFWPAFITAVGTIVLIGFFGVIYEFRRKAMKCAEKQALV